jgi:hypothetical protein
MNPKVLDKSFQHGRLSKANQFALAASIFFDDAMRSTDLADTYVTLAIHSGIAAADVICARELGEYSATSSHRDAVALLKRANTMAAEQLSRLLELKSKAGYGHRAVTEAETRIAERAHKKLLEIALLS